MKYLIRKITNAHTWHSDYLVAFGPLGLFAVAFLDSSFVPLPSSADALMILLTTAHPGWMVLYALIATVGSALGCMVLYYASRRAGRRALSRFSPAKQERVKELIDRYDVLSVLVASVLPPPFPFKLFVVSAGVFRFSITRFMIAIMIGRGFRFLLEGYLAIRYGAQAKVILARYYPWIGLGLAVLIVATFLFRSFRKRRATLAGQRLEAGN